MTKQIKLEKTGRASGRVLINGKDFGARWEIQGSTIVLIYAGGATHAYATQGDLERDVAHLALPPKRTDNLPLTFDW
jgi:hypothetical protein